MSDFRKQFGIFTGFYNQTNGTSITVAEALKSENLRALFDAMQQDCAAFNEVVKPQLEVSTAHKSTRMRSFETVAVAKGQQDILNVLRAHPNINRREIAGHLGKENFINAVAARCSELLRAGRIQTTGEGVCAITNKATELLSVR